MPKKQFKPHKPSKKWKKYTLADNKLERKKTCPKCGPSIFLAEHKDRYCCGKCHYMEVKEKK